MRLILAYVAQEEIPQAMELAESLGAEGGKMVRVESLGVELPEFDVPDHLSVAFMEGFRAAGVTSLRVSNAC